MTKGRSPSDDDECDEPRGRWRRGQIRTRSLVLLAALAAVWTWVLADSEIGSFVLVVLGALGVTLAMIGLAMGLGLLGFGLFTVGDRVVTWIRRASQWPEE